MPKMAQLIMVEANNAKTGAQNNKFYNMEENGDGTFTVKYGRIGSTQSVVKYSMGDWEKKYREKIKKGYTDHTDIFLEKDTKGSFKEISDLKISRIVSELQRYANNSVSENYISGTGSVTQKQIARVQELLNELVESVSGITPQNTKLIESSNNTLLEIFRVIPRKMSDVRNYLIQPDKTSDQHQFIESVNQIIGNEQKTLDVLEGQVNVLDCTTSDTNILEAIGIEIYNVDDSEVSMIKKMLDDSQQKFVEAFKWTNGMEI